MRNGPPSGGGDSQTDREGKREQFHGLGVVGAEGQFITLIGKL